MLGIFLDIETNGLNTKRHKIIEIAYKIIDLCTGKMCESFETTVCHPREEWEQSNPHSLKVNGLKWQDIKKGMNPQKVADLIQASFAQTDVARGKAVFICQNPSFDRAFFSQLIDADIQEALKWPYHWLDLASMHWMHCLSKKGGKLPWETGLSKNEIATFYHLPIETIPHKAMNGVNHLLLCYQTFVGFPESKTSRCCPSFKRGESFN